MANIHDAAVGSGQVRKNSYDFIFFWVLIALLGILLRWEYMQFITFDRKLKWKIHV